MKCVCSAETRARVYKEETAYEKAQRKQRVCHVLESMAEAQHAGQGRGVKNEAQIDGRQAGGPS